MEGKEIDLSDRSQYPASVLADLNYAFALDGDNENMLIFLHGKWLRPSFHWGWKDCTHEQAVESDFLYRAFCAMNSQYRKRRDAMVASEGCRFVWKDKGIEPVPGILSGEELCDYMNRCLEKDLPSIKSFNASEDRDFRCKWLKPTYDDLMADMKKNDKDADFYHRDLGCGMLSFRRKGSTTRSFIVNLALKKVYPIAEGDGKIIAFTLDDIEWDNVNQLENHGDAIKLIANYYIEVCDYKDGVARVAWLLYPDGRYFADEDGYGMEDNDRTYVSAYIDTECRVLVKFQDMTDPEKEKALYQEACRINKARRGTGVEERVITKKGNEGTKDVRKQENDEEDVRSIILRWFKSGSKASVVISLLVLMVAVSACHSNMKNDGKADAWYEEVKRNVDDVRVLATAVTLPDSLAEKDNVKCLRAFLARACSWELAYLSWMRECKMYEKEKGVIGDADQLEQMKNASELVEILQNLNCDAQNMLTEGRFLIEDMARAQLVQCSINTLMFDRVEHTQCKYDSLRASMDEELRRNAEKRGEMASLSTMQNYLADEIHEDNYQAIHHWIINFMTAINIRLYHIRSESTGK